MYTLLAGKSPFFSESDPSTAFRVKTCQWTLEEELFAGSSASAKDFITNCLVLDPRKRMTIEQCLAHPWLKLHSAKGEWEGNDSINGFEHYIITNYLALDPFRTISRFKANLHNAVQLLSPM